MPIWRRTPSTTASTSPTRWLDAGGAPLQWRVFHTHLDARGPEDHDRATGVARPQRAIVRNIEMARARGMSEKSADREVPKAAAGRRGLVLAAAMMATFMTAVETTIVATAMPTIVADLGDFHLFSWVFAVYLLAQAVSIPIYGRLADLYGRKRIFFVGASVFLLGSTLCGFARGMLALIAFRALQGIGAGAVQPVAYTIVGDIYSPTERAQVQGFLSSVFGCAAVVGPTLGAFL